MAWRSRLGRALLRAAARPATGAAPGPARPPAPAACATRELHSSPAPAQEARSRPPSPPPPPLPEFHRCADLAIGGLWTRLEAELRTKAATYGDVPVSVSEGCLCVALPDGAALAVCKDAARRRVVVAESGVAADAGGAEARCEVGFDMQDGGGPAFASGGVALHEYVESSFAKHMKVELDLEPRGGPGVYAADPT